MLRAGDFIVCASNKVPHENRPRHNPFPRLKQQFVLSSFRL